MSIHEIMLDTMLLFAGLSGAAAWKRSNWFFVTIPLCAAFMIAALLTR